jgi:uncharacterized protein
MRVRLHGPLAGVELSPEELDIWLAREKQAELRSALLASGFERAAIDLAGFRSGSLNLLGGIGRA